MHFDVVFHFFARLELDIAQQFDRLEQEVFQNPLFIAGGDAQSVAIYPDIVPQFDRLEQDVFRNMSGSDRSFQAKLMFPIKM